MTDKTQPLALMLADRLHHEQPTVLRIDAEHAGEELRRQHARIAELEARLEAVGAGDVQALSAAPAGWNLVPAEVTSEMWEAFKRPNGKAGDCSFDERYAALLAASPTPPAEQQATKETSGGFHVWRDISTAPKDGSRFVATGHNYGLYSEVRHTCVAQWFRGCWMEASDWNETSELKYLTHWMPLPSPPDDVAAPTEQQAAQASGVLKAIREANMQLVRTGDGAFMLVPYKLATAEQQAAPKTAPGEPGWWRKRADEIEVQVALTGSQEAMRCYTDMRTLLQAAAEATPQPAPAPLSDDVSQKTWALIDELEKLRGANRDEEDWGTLNRLDSELRAALAARGGRA